MDKVRGVVIDSWWCSKLKCFSRVARYAEARNTDKTITEITRANRLFEIVRW